MPRVNEQVLETLAVQGNTSTVYKYRKRKGHDIVAYSVTTSTGSATFTGTFKLEVSTPGANVWVDVPDGSFTAETSGTFVPGSNMDIRWNCVAYTTGSQIVRIG